MRLAATAVSALLLWIAVSVGNAQSPLPDSFDPGPNGPVFSLAVQADAKILVGGGFTTLGGEQRIYIARLNADGSVDGGFNPGADNGVTSLAVQADRKILVGGWFRTLGGQARKHIARLDADGSVDGGFNPGADDTVSSLAMRADGKILVGGNFTTLGGQSHRRIARLNADGTLDGSFNPGADNGVFCLAVQANGKILVGGWFSRVCGQRRNFLARLNPDGSLDSGFNPGANGYVHSLAVQAGGKILVGGEFTRLAGQPRNRIGRLNADGTLDSGFNPRANDWVSSLAVQANGKILVGGWFTTMGGQPRNGIARLNANGTLDSLFDPRADDAVYSVAVQADGKILLGGRFNTLGPEGQRRSHLGRLNNTEPASQSLSYDGSKITWLRGGSSPEVWRTSFDFSTNGSVWALLGRGSRIAGGWRWLGEFLPPGGTLRARGYVSGGYYNASGGWIVETYYGKPGFIVQPVSRTNDAGTTATFNVEAGSAERLSFQWLKEGALLADGGNIAGAATALLMLTNVLGVDAGGYSVIVSNGFGVVTSAVARLTVIDPAIVLQPASQKGEAGQSVAFSVTASGTAPFTYEWRKEGVTLAGGTGVSLIVTNLQASDAGSYCVVVSNPYGSVTSAVALLTVNLATVDGGFNPGASGDVLSLALQADEKILLGGNFAILCGQQRDRIARLNPDGALDSGFNPAAGLYYPRVSSLAVQADGKIVVGGEFTLLAGQIRKGIARLNADGTLDNGFDAGADAYVDSLVVQADGKILVGGDFRTLAGQPRSRIARLTAEGTLDSGFNPGADQYVTSLALQADGKILVGGGFTMVSGQPRNRIARLNPDGTLDNGFNPGAGKDVLSLAVQADGKILVGGSFGTMGGQQRSYLARLNSDGTVDSGFNPGADQYVTSLALQADGKILIAGGFSTVGGQARNRIARLNADGSLDNGFNPGADKDVLSLAVQADGKILVGGGFTIVGGQQRSRVGRLNNTEPASQSLSYDGSTITWFRGSTSPEVWRTSFEVLTNGSDWSPLGAGSRIPGGWGLAGVSLSPDAKVRARGYVCGGYHNGSGWFVETVSQGPWSIRLDVVRDGSDFVLNWTGGIGPYQLQQTTNLGTSNSWENVGEPVQTNSMKLPLGTRNLFLRVRGQ